MSRHPISAGCLALTGACLGAGAATAAAPQSQTSSFRIEAPCARIFHLFTAEGERAWAPGWEPEILSGAVERGSVFRTVADGRETVWVVTEYQPEQGRVGYARIAQGSNMGLVDVRCSDAPDGASLVSVTYTLTPLNPEAHGFVEEFLGSQRYAAYIQEWRQAIATYLATPP